MKYLASHTSLPVFCLCSQMRMSVKEKRAALVLQIRSVRTSREDTHVNVNWDLRWLLGNAKVKIDIVTPYKVL